MGISRRRPRIRRALTARVLLFLLLGVALIIGLGMANRQLSQVTEFGPRFRVGLLAARTLWLRGQSPYDPEAISNTLASAGEAYLESPLGDPPPSFAEPIWSLLPFGALLLLPSQSVPVIWLTATQLLQPIVTLLALFCIGWRPRPPTLAAALLLSLLWFYGLQPMLLGAPASLAISGVLILYGGLRQNRWPLVVAGTILAAMDFRLAGLPLAIGWMSALMRRKTAAAILQPVSIAALGLIGWAIEPGWMIGWARALVSVTREGAAPALVATLGAAPLVVMAAGASLALLLWQWVVIGGEEARAFSWLSALTLATTYLIAARSEPVSAGLMLPATLLALRTWHDHGGRLGIGLSLMLLSALVLLPWALFLGQGESATDTPALVLWLPWLTVYPALWWIRWWAVRPVELDQTARWGVSS